MLNLILKTERMKTGAINSWVDELTELSEGHIKRIQSKFKHLSENQKKWKPNEHSWSLLEIFAHLNEFAKYYHPVFEDKIKNTKFKEAKAPFLSSPLGKSAWKSMKLGNARNVKRKFKAQKNYNPSVNVEMVKGDDIERFVENQSRFMNILNQAKNINLRRSKVPISLSRIVRLRMGDALMYVAYHEDRHVEQAFKLFKHPNFPKKK